MRLLTRQQHEAELKAEDLRKLKRAEEIVAFLSKAEKSLNDFKDHDTAERRRISQEHASFVQEKQAEIAKLEDAVRVLEERKRIALEPIDKDRAMADKLLSDAHTRSAELDAQEAKLLKSEEVLTSLVQDAIQQLHQIAQEKAVIVKREKELEQRKKDFAAHVRFKEWQIRTDRNKARELIEQVDKKLNP